MQPIAKLLITLGIVLIISGLIWQFGGKHFSFAFGKLPGDIAVQRGNMRFYFPIMSCVLLSLGFSLILYIIRLFR